MIPMSDEDLDNRFGYHAPKDEATKDNHGAIRDLLRDAAGEIRNLTPPGREQSLAVTHLEEAMFWANAAIARAANNAS